MNPEILKNIIQSGEGVDVEFKKARFKLPKNVYESVCAMLNRQGGYLFLGVTDSGEIEGVSENSVTQIKKDFATSVNNPAQLSPKYYLNIHDISLNGETVLYTYIPESSQVHSYLGKVYDRNEDGDFDISNNPDLVRQLHIKKQGSFSENTIFPALCLSDFRKDLIQRCRTLANNNHPGHSWMELDDEKMLRSANLFKKDYKTGQEGYTMAAVLLLGKDEVIRQILPHYKTDAILRRQNMDRYDDREIVKTNLIESYDRLMAFTAKHLPDKFYLEKDQRISIRDNIFREIIANTLIHREYSNEYPARFIIEHDMVLLENWNRPHGSGKLKLDSYTPFPKNPVIAAFFREIGRAEELGSGFRNAIHYTKFYSGGLEPDFEEGDIFKISIPLITEVAGVTRETAGVTRETAGVTRETAGVNRIIVETIEHDFEGARQITKKKLSLILKMINENEGKRIPEYAELTHMNDRTLERHIKQLREAELIEFLGDTPKTGGYFITENLKQQIKSKISDERKR